MKRKICKNCRAKRNQNQFFGDSKICKKCLCLCSKCGSKLDQNKKCVTCVTCPLKCFEIEMKKLDIANCLQIAGTDIFKAFRSRRGVFFRSNNQIFNPEQCSDILNWMSNKTANTFENITFGVENTEHENKR